MRQSSFSGSQRSSKSPHFVEVGRSEDGEGVNVLSKKEAHSPLRTRAGGATRCQSLLIGYAVTASTMNAPVRATIAAKESKSLFMARSE
jgi:hypothetical protein